MPELVPSESFWHTGSGIWTSPFPREGSSLGAGTAYLRAALGLSAPAVPLVPNTAQFSAGVPAAAWGRQPRSMAAARHPCCGQSQTPNVPSCSAEAGSSCREQN